MGQDKEKAGKLVVISGPSGVGKSTICRGVVNKLDAYLSISATTRPKGPNETEGVEYYFLTKEEFQQGLNQPDL